MHARARAHGRRSGAKISCARAQFWSTVSVRSPPTKVLTTPTCIMPAAVMTFFRCPMTLSRCAGIGVKRVGVVAKPRDGQTLVGQHAHDLVTRARASCPRPADAPCPHSAASRRPAAGQQAISSASNPADAAQSATSASGHVGKRCRQDAQFHVVLLSHLRPSGRSARFPAPRRRTAFRNARPRSWHRLTQADRPPRATSA